MALIHVNLNPSARELKWFGVLLLAAFTGLGCVIAVRGSAPKVAVALWCVGVALCLVYYLVRPLRLVLYLIWMQACYPIGWAVSHFVLAVAYYLVVTPIGLLMRLAGRDPLPRKFDREVKTYWVPHSPAERDRYFRQY